MTSVGCHPGHRFGGGLHGSSRLHRTLYIPNHLPDTEKEKFRYKLPEIYSIWIMDYPVGFMGEGVYRDEVALYNKSKVGTAGCIPSSTKNKYIIIDLTKFDNPAIEDALRRIECGTVSEELLIRQANMTDYINVCRAAVAESYDDGYEKGVEKGVADEHTRNEATNNRRAEFLRSHNVSDDLISAMLAIK